MRQIDDILLFRGDISPFLVHLTRYRIDNSQPTWANGVLREILESGRLKPAGTQISDIRFGGATVGAGWDDEKRKKFLGAVCFTETPLNEVHCLLEIDKRSIQLEEYGIVFLKKELLERGVSPVLYLNNKDGTMNLVAAALFALIQSHPEAAEKLLPLFSVFGQKLIPLGRENPPPGDLDFRWEREWRYPASRGDFAFTSDGIFVCLCPHQEIDNFEKDFPSLKFIDPRRNMKWYASKLLERRQHFDLKHSVV